MIRLFFLLATTGFLLLTQPALGKEPAENSQQVTQGSAGDPRQLVSMPEQSREFMRQDMLEHLFALNEILTHLAENDLNAAADVAESKMGKSTMGKHRVSGMGPGRFMPLEMRKIGWGMHEAATEFSQIAKQGDIKKAYTALHKLTTTCVACHYTYRTR